MKAAFATASAAAALVAVLALPSAAQQPYQPYKAPSPPVMTPRLAPQKPALQPNCTSQAECKALCSRTWKQSGYSSMSDCAISACSRLPPSCGRLD
jgi:hypothetical protein